MKKGKIIIGGIMLAVVLAAAFIYFCVPISTGGSAPEWQPALAADVLLTAEQVAEDRDAAITFVEDAHPYFALVDDQTAYAQAKQQFENATAGEMSVGELQTAVAEYLCFFADGHTQVWWEEQDYLALPMAYLDGNTYRVDDGRVTERCLEKIGGVSMDEIYAAIDRVMPAENEMATKTNRENYLGGRSLLKLAGVDVQQDSITVTYTDGTEEETYFYNPTTADAENSQAEAAHPANGWHMEGDIFVVDFVECVFDDNFEKIVEELENAVQNGCSKVIIDARGNGGGNSGTCTRLLTAMGMKAPEYDMIIRYSPEAKQQRGYLRSRGLYRAKGSSGAKANEAVELVVLCDRYTFSSATMLCVFVRDGGLGKLIGEPSSNMPNSYGDILYMVLPNSHIFATVSHKQFVRPDEKNTERVLIPDIRTESEDAYQRAVEYFK